jgi:hypothetical protein
MPQSLPRLLLQNSEDNNMRNIPVILILLIMILKPGFGDLPAQGTESAVYSGNIRTVQFHRSGNMFSLPVMTLNTDEKLILSFDDLDPLLIRYRFTIVHCTARWEVSENLTGMDYIDGWSEENIDRFTYSFNTLVPYIHYTAEFPTTQMKPLLSGNYILKVYIDDPSEPVIIARFMVIEKSPVRVEGEITQPLDAETRFSKQQIDFTVRLNGFPAMDPAREILAVIMQNGRWDPLMYVTGPRFIRGDELDYSHDEKIAFNGLNEFRQIDTKSLKYQSERIARITYDTAWHVFLLDDQKRTMKNYVMEKDINGRYLIKNEESAGDADLESDYTWVHFTLPHEYLPAGQEIYITGGLTGWQQYEQSAMRYNFPRKRYEATLFLKQGYYNYLYLLGKEGFLSDTESMIEGNHWETENEYSIFIYYREPGGLSDRLLSMFTLIR